MLSPAFFVETLKENNVDFFTGVPDSLLKSICAYLKDNCSQEKNITTANEGSAVGLATGSYLATGKIPVVYMQNSGIGNAVNPLLSLTDKAVYNIPLLLLIGWRGEPGSKDEPQHVTQGRLTIPLLETMGIKYCILSDQAALFKKQIEEGVAYMKETSEPFALVVRKNTFEDYKLNNNRDLSLKLSREEAIRLVAGNLNATDVVVATTGMISRELFEYRESVNEGHGNDFLTVGAMGHASQIALGIAMEKRDQGVYCFDGDGACLMHMGGLAIIGSIAPGNFIHVVFNNGAHDSVGGQPTVAFHADLTRIAASCGYKRIYSVDNKVDLEAVLQELKTMEGPLFLEVKVKKGARKDLGRPTTTPVENKKALMDILNR